MERLLKSLDAAVDVSEMVIDSFRIEECDPTRQVVRQVRMDAITKQMNTSKSKSVEAVAGPRNPLDDPLEYRTVEQSDGTCVVSYHVLQKGSLPFSDAQLLEAKTYGDHQIGTTSAYKATLPRDDDLKRAIYQFGDFLCRECEHGLTVPFSLSSKSNLSTRKNKTITDLILYQPEPIASAFTQAVRAYRDTLHQRTRRMQQQDAEKHQLHLVQKALEVTTKRLQKLRNPPKPKSVTNTEPRKKRPKGSASSEASTVTAQPHTPSSVSSSAETDDSDYVNGGDPDANQRDTEYGFRSVYGTWEVGCRDCVFYSPSTASVLSFGTGSVTDSYGSIDDSNIVQYDTDMDEELDPPSASQTHKRRRSDSDSDDGDASAGGDTLEESLSYGSGSVSDSYAEIDPACIVVDDFEPSQTVNRGLFSDDSGSAADEGASPALHCLHDLFDENESDNENEVDENADSCESARGLGLRDLFGEDDGGEGINEHRQDELGLRDLFGEDDSDESINEHRQDELGLRDLFGEGDGDEGSNEQRQDELSLFGESGNGVGESDDGGSGAGSVSFHSEQESGLEDVFDGNDDGNDEQSVSSHVPVLGGLYGVD